VLDSAAFVVCSQINVWHLENIVDVNVSKEPVVELFSTVSPTNDQLTR